MRKTHRILAVEEGWPQSGVSSGDERSRALRRGRALQAGGERHEALVFWNGMVGWQRKQPHCQALTVRGLACGAEITTIAVEEAFDDLDAPPERITGAEVPMPYAANLEAACLPNVEDIVRVAKRMLGKP